MPYDLTDDEMTALIELLLDTIERDHSRPPSPRVKVLRRILAKLIRGRL